MRALILSGFSASGFLGCRGNDTPCLLQCLCTLGSRAVLVEDGLIRRHSPARLHYATVAVSWLTLRGRSGSQMGRRACGLFSNLLAFDFGRVGGAGLLTLRMLMLRLGDLADDLLLLARSLCQCLLYLISPTEAAVEISNRLLFDPSNVHYGAEVSDAATPRETAASHGSRPFAHPPGGNWSHFTSYLVIPSTSRGESNSGIGVKPSDGVRLRLVHGSRSKDGCSGKRRNSRSGSASG